MKLEFKKIPGTRSLGIYISKMIDGALHVATCDGIDFIPFDGEYEAIPPVIIINSQDIVNRAELVKQLPLELKHALYPPCPKCTSSEVVPIYYGSSDKEEDDYVTIRPDDSDLPDGSWGKDGTHLPMWHCKECGHQWGGSKREKWYKEMKALS